MNNSQKNLLFAALGLLSLAMGGCFTPPGASAPTHYYRLEYNTSTEPLPEAKAARKILLKVGVAPALGNPRVIVATSEYELDYRETHRWAEPLASSLGRVLAEELRARFAAVEIPPVPDGFEPDCRVKVTIEKLWGTSKGEVVLEVRWVVVDSQGRWVASDEAAFRQKGWTVGNYKDLAQRVSALTPKVAGAIAKSLSSLDSTDKKP